MRVSSLRVGGMSVLFIKVNVLTFFFNPNMPVKEFEWYKVVQEDGVKGSALPVSPGPLPRQSCHQFLTSPRVGLYACKDTLTHAH